jgi:hypothetical protein
MEHLFNEIAIDPDTVKFLADTGSDPLPGTSNSLRALLAKDTQAWREYVRIANIAPT